MCSRSILYSFFFYSHTISIHLNLNTWKILNYAKFTLIIMFSDNIMSLACHWSSQMILLVLEVVVLLQYCCCWRSFCYMYIQKFCITDLTWDFIYLFFSFSCLYLDVSSSLKRDCSPTHLPSKSPCTIATRYHSTPNTNQVPAKVAEKRKNL